MGIRMHLAVGYGLDLSDLNTDLISDFERLEDKKLFQSFVQHAIENAEDRDDLQDKMSLGFAMGTKHHRPGRDAPEYFFETMEYDSEFGLPDKLLLYPLGYRSQWHRYGDLLDIFTYEAEHGGDYHDLTPEWTEKPGTLYPFVGLMCANPDKPLGYETYWKPCFLDKEEHKDAIPVAPAHLWHLIRFLELTDNDEDTARAFLSLRPTVYRWWS